jgi:hypothetical protein
MGPEQKPEKPWFLDAAFIVPLSIFIAYFCALSLTIGVYSYFNIPYDFISLNPTIVLAKSREYLAIFAMFLLPYMVAHFFAYIMEKNPRRVGFYILACLFELCTLWIISSYFNPEKTLMWSIAVCLTVYVVVITPLCIDDLMAYQKRKIQKRSSNSLRTIQRWDYFAIFIALCVIVGGYFGFYNWGRYIAKNADTFYVVKQSVDGRVPDVVFLGNYGDYLVGVPFHRDTKKFESFVIWKMPQADNIHLTLNLLYVST